MKTPNDEMRGQYKRSDFTRLERAKFHKAAIKGSCVALYDPAVKKEPSRGPKW